MSTQRVCKRCGGHEFLMTTCGGVVISWRSSDGKEGTWFCPECDWGDGRPTQRRAA
jgi:phage/plasmid primase-like uncharacterized protein